MKTYIVLVVMSISFYIKSMEKEVDCQVQQHYEYVVHEAQESISELGSASFLYCVARSLLYVIDTTESLNVYDKEIFIEKLIHIITTPQTTSYNFSKPLQDYVTQLSALFDKDNVIRFIDSLAKEVQKSIDQQRSSCNNVVHGVTYINDTYEREINKIIRLKQQLHYRSISDLCLYALEIVDGIFMSLQTQVAYAQKRLRKTAKQARYDAPNA